jgi:cobalt/nickel transport system permease protein
MHISEGVLSVPVLGIGAAAAAAGLALGLRRLDNARLPHAALLAAVFFVASLIHVPIGPTSAHLLLNGVIGLLLGWGAFPAVLVGLVLQAILFQFGGLVVLGVNTLDMALPAVVCAGLFAPMARSGRPGLAMAGGFLAGAGSVALSGAMTSLALFLSGERFGSTAAAILLAHIPVMAVEGVVTALVVSFLHKVKPEVLRPAPVLAAGAGGRA